MTVPLVSPAQGIITCSEFIDKLDEYRLFVNKMVRAKKYQRLFDMTKKAPAGAGSRDLAAQDQGEGRPRAVRQVRVPVERRPGGRVRSVPGGRALCGGL